MAMIIGCFIKFLIVIVLRSRPRPRILESRLRGRGRGRIYSANKSSNPSFRPVLASKIVAPRPFGGGAASFWKKFGNVFFTHAGFLILMPGTFNPRSEERRVGKEGR